MPSKRINIPTTGANRFVLSDTNPNPHGECVCSPRRRHEDCKGPFAVFTHSELDHEGVARRIKVVQSARCAKAIVVAVERGAEIGRVGGGSPTDDDFDGGVPTESLTEKELRSRYETLATHVPLSELPSWDEYKAEHGDELPSVQAPAVTTGIDPNALPLHRLTRPVGIRGGEVHGYTDEKPGSSAYEGVPESMQVADGD